MELLERERSLEALTSALNDVASTCGRAVLISGDAGIGKTAIVEHFVRLNQHWARVLWGGCEALFTPRPLGPLYDIAHQADSDLLKLLETRTPRPSIFAAFLDDLRASGRPTILVFEDVHWADEATLDMIKFLGRRIHQVRAMLIMTYRGSVNGNESAGCRKTQTMPLLAVICVMLRLNFAYCQLHSRPLQRVKGGLLVLAGAGGSL